MKFLVIVLLFLIGQVYSGQISGYDIVIDHINVNLVSRYTLIFSLETEISSNDYLKMILPYNLHVTLNGQIPNLVTASFAQHQNLTMINKISYTTCSLVFTGGAYYVQFRNTLGIAVGLKSGIFYDLRLQTASGAAVPTSGFKNPI